VWLSAEMTSPYAFYQYWVNVEDASVGHLLRVFTDRSAGEIEQLEAAVRERPQAREAQRTLATDVTALVHGSAAAESAVAASGALFGRGELGSVDQQTLRAALREAGLHAVEGELPSIVGLLVATGLARSLSEARRVVAEGGAYLNNVRISDPDHLAGERDLLFGRYLVVRRGKKAVAGAELQA
jgi:tyrosyl-tRNA synthetase